MPSLSLRPFLSSLLVAAVLVTPACREVSQPALDAADQQESPVLFPVEQQGAWGYITRTGRVVIAPQFDRAYCFVDNRALIQQEGRFGFIDTTGSIVIPPEYADAWHFSEGLAPVQRDSLWGFIDRAGTMVVDPQFDLAPSVIEESRPDSAFRRTRVEGQYGYRNPEGTLVIPPEFDQAWYFSEGRARIKKEGKWGYIDRTGTTVIAPRFTQAWDFQNGLARVRLDDGQMGYVTPSGSLVWPPSP